MTLTVDLKHQEAGYCATAEQKKLTHSVHRNGESAVPDEQKVEIPFKLKQELVTHLQYPKMEHAMNILSHRLRCIREMGSEGKDWRYTVDGELEIRSNLYSKKTFGMLVIRFGSDGRVASWSWKGRRSREVRLKKAPLPYGRSIIISPHSMKQYVKRRGNSSRIYAFPEIVKAYVEEEMAIQTTLERSWYKGRLQWLLPLPQFGVIAVFIHDIDLKTVVMTTTLSPFQAGLQVLASNPWRPSKRNMNNMKKAVEA